MHQNDDKSDIAIEVKNLNKTFNIYPDLVNSRIKQFFLPQKKFYVEKTALSNVNVTIKKGEIVGVLGPNGSGKTTLLKIIAGISYPTTGKVLCNGRVVAVLALGLGFHPRLSGLENIELSGMMLGMTRKEIKQKKEWIVSFSELGEYISRPLTTYSSGMKARLSFAIAACQEPEILIIDEALATGDIRFVQKCMHRIHEITQAGSTALFVSHNIWSIKKLTQRCILLYGGNIIADGETTQVTDQYHEVMLKSEVFDKTVNAHDFNDFVGTGEVKLVSVQLRDSQKSLVTLVNSGEEVSIILELNSIAETEVGISLTCWRDDGVIATVSSGLAGGCLDQEHVFKEKTFKLKVGANTLVLEYVPLLLGPGDYYFDLQIYDTKNYSGYVSNQQFYFKTRILEFGVRKLKNPNRLIMYYQPENIYLRD